MTRKQVNKMKKISTVLAITLLGIVTALGISYARAENESSNSQQSMLESAVEDGIVDQNAAPPTSSNHIIESRDNSK